MWNNLPKEIGEAKLLEGSLGSRPRGKKPREVKMTIPVIAALPGEQLGHLHPAISQGFDVGKKREGAEGKEPNQPPENCTNFLHA